MHENIFYLILSLLFSFVINWPRWMNSELEFLGTVMWALLAFGICWVVIFRRRRGAAK